jgi:hypothetical protein
MGQNNIPASKTDRNREVDFISDLSSRHCIPILIATPEKQPSYPPIVLQTLSKPPALPDMLAVLAAGLTIPDGSISRVVSGWSQLVRYSAMNGLSNAASQQNPKGLYAALHFAGIA